MGRGAWQCARDLVSFSSINVEVRFSACYGSSRGVGLGWLDRASRRPRFDSAQRSLEAGADEVAEGVVTEAGVGVSGGEGGLVEVDDVAPNFLRERMVVAQAVDANFESV